MIQAKATKAGKPDSGPHRSPPRLAVPTPERVVEANRRFDEGRYGAADRILSRIFSTYRENTVFDDILLKVALLNALYTTRIFALTEMAAHIEQLGIDGDLRAGNLHVVDRIAPLTIRGKTRCHYSFATKYCSFHQPDRFPIYDSLVAAFLVEFRRQYDFAAFTRADLQDYERYTAVVAAFQSHFGLQAFSFKQLDKFLWFTSSELNRRAAS